jgi:hypothetical protein
VTQPAVSLQVQNLEKQLDIAIFDRGGRKAQLTEAGKLLLNCKSCLREARCMVVPCQDHNSVSIQLDPSLAGYCCFGRSWLCHVHRL